MSSWPWLGADQLARLTASSLSASSDNNSNCNASLSSSLLGLTAAASSSAMNIHYATILQQAGRASLQAPPPPPLVPVTASLPYSPDVFAMLGTVPSGVLAWNAPHGIRHNNHNHSFPNIVRDVHSSSLESKLLLRELEICRSQQLLLQQSSLQSANPAATAGASSVPAKLFAVLSTPELEHIVSWMPHGKAWKIRDLSSFIEQILPLFGDFGSYRNSIDSFIRTLKRWGFKQFLKGPDVSAYYHEMFIRDRPALHTLMRPCTSYESRALHSPANEPDFYRDDTKSLSPSMEKLVASLFHRTSVASDAARVIPAQHRHGLGDSYHSTAPPGLTGSAWSEHNLPSLVHVRPPPLLSASANHSPTVLSPRAHAELVRALLKSGQTSAADDTSRILAEKMSLLSNVDDFKLGMAARDAQAMLHNAESKPPATATSSTPPSISISSSLVGKAITMTQFQQQLPRDTHIVQDDETSDQRKDFTLEDAKRIVELADKKKKQTEKEEALKKSSQEEELKSTPAAISQEKIETKMTATTAPPDMAKPPVTKKKKVPKKQSTSGEAISASATKNRRKWLPKLGPPPAPEEESDSKEKSVDIEWYFTNPELFAAISEKSFK